MKRILLFLFVCVSFSIFSQSIWTKGNAVWHYSFYNVGERGYTKLWEAGDTTVLGIACTTIKRERHSFISGSNGSSFESVTSLSTGVIYTSNDTVFYWDNDADRFFVLYDFSAQVNDQWVLQTKEAYFDCNDTSVCVVESAGSVSLNGQNAIQLTVSHTSDSPSELIGTVNSRFGATGCYLLPFPRRCDNPGSLDLDQVELICFQDDSLYYNPSDGACEYYLGLDQLQYEDIRIYPNPTSNKLNILSDASVSSIEIFDSYGKRCFAQSPDLTFTELDLSGLNSGIYLVQITTNTGQVTIRRIQRN